MSKLPQIIVIDDEQLRLDNAQLSYDAHGLNCGLKLIQSQIADYNIADNELRNLIGPAIILLDLGFRFSDQEEIPKLEEENLKSISVRCDLQILRNIDNAIKSISLDLGIGGKHLIEGIRIDGISLIESIFAGIFPCWTNSANVCVAESPWINVVSN